MSVKSSGRLKRVIKDFKTVNNSIIDIGIVEPILKVKDGKTVQLALVYKTQEEGSKANNVPKRPTLRPGVKDAKYRPKVKNLVTNIAVGNGPTLGLNKIAEVAVLKVKTNIQGIKAPRLSLRTILSRINKGTTNPLVDTGQLKKRIDSKVGPK